MPWIAVALACWAAETSAAVGPENLPQPEGDRWLATSPSFIVRNYHPSQNARQVAVHCEHWREKLQKYWAADSMPPWSLRCTVTVHANSTHYLSVVGPGGARTFGASSIAFAKAKEVKRRAIDLRGDDPRGIAALPHEMTHVLLADWLGGRQPPRWADEGMAILADIEAKKRRHEHDLSHSLATGESFHLAELFAIETQPHPGRVAAFYGQSASLAALLAKRDDPARFVEFLRRSLDAGYDRALREVYHLQGLAHLERHWQEQRSAGHRCHGYSLPVEESGVLTEE